MHNDPQSVIQLKRVSDKKNRFVLLKLLSLDTDIISVNKLSARFMERKRACALNAGSCSLKKTDFKNLETSRNDTVKNKVSYMTAIRKWKSMQS